MDQRKGTILHTALHLAAAPGRLVRHPLTHLFHRYYKEKSFARTLFVIDIILVATIIVLTSVFTYLLFRSASITDQVVIDATVAPTEIVSGSASTLIFRYENQSDEELRNARLALTFPAHFERLEEASGADEHSAQVFDLGTIAPDAHGQIKIRGVMFGDVGGDQLFASSLSFTYGERNALATKKSEHSFRPERSTLALELRLPERLVAGQEVSGQIVYKNTGEINFPEISIEPVWPADFTLISSDPSLANGNFRLRALAAGEEGVMEFRGRLPGMESIDFSFHPSFTFGEDRYKQETLSQTVTLLPSQLTARAEPTSAVLTPGGMIEVNILYEHTGEFAIENATVTISSDPSVFTKDVVTTIGSLAPGATGEITVSVPIIARPIINTTSIKTTTSYILEGTTDTISVVTDRDSIKITTPVVLEAFARYSSPQGDQLGRGPLPPIVGEETKYWIFLTVRSTTNAINNVHLDADLGPGVSFTGKQSVSVGEQLTYLAESNSIEWKIPSIDPTVRDGVVSVAFEVAIVPTEAMLGKTPTLVSGPFVRGQDAFTGAQVIGRGVTITTNLPYDAMAAGLGIVE